MLDTFLYIAPPLFIYIGIGFFLSVLWSRNDLADVMWGPGIFLCAILSVLTHEHISTQHSIALVLVGIWALRIFLHIGTRFWYKDNEDPRYALWRTTWSWVYTRSFFQVFLLQGFLMAFMASIFLLEAPSMPSASILFGVALALFGLFYEAVGDYQLRQFISEQKKLGAKGGLMTSGLWATTRHPNYFGEVTFWWGIFSIFLADVFLTQNILFFLTPLLITLLILKVSGIPLLEKQYEGRADWEAHKAKTPAFFPRWW
jgi:steroid 5-alpha reductase family enzyme